MIIFDLFLNSKLSKKSMIDLRDFNHLQKIQSIFFCKIFDLLKKI